MKLSKNNNIIYSPTDITTYVESPFASWMDRASLCIPELKEKKKLSKKLKVLSQKGTNFEMEVLKEFQKKLKVFIVPEENSKEETINAMKKGYDVIFQAHLIKDDIEGFADFLVKTKGKSKLGNHHYEVKDTKLSRLPKAKFILQLSAYNEMLSEIQGNVAQFVYIILGTGIEEKYEVSKFNNYYQIIKKDFYKYHANFNLEKKPLPDLDEKMMAWENEGKRYLHQKNDISLIANISMDQIKKLRDQNINTLKDVLKTKNQKLIPNDQWNKIKDQAYVQSVSRVGEESKIKLLKNVSETKGLSRISPPSDFDIFLNIEESTLAHQDGLVYHLGFLSNEYYISVNNTKKSTEKENFEKFIEKLKVKQINKIYIFGSQSLNILKKLSAQYNTEVEFIMKLIYSYKVVDIKEIILQSMVIGVENYSLGSLRKFYPHLDIEDSKILFEDYYKSVPKFQNMILNKIRWNNKYKTQAIRELYALVVRLQKIEKISFVKYEDTEEGRLNEIVQKERQARKEKSQSEVEEVEEVEIKAPSFSQKEYDDMDQDERIDILMKQLNNFYDTEDRPKQVETRAKFNLIESDWMYDLDCLSYLKFNAQDEKRIQRFYYTFDPSQDTKVSQGDTVKLFHNKLVSGKVIDIDLKKGLIAIDFTKKYLSYVENRPLVSIIRDNFINKKSLKESIKNLYLNFNKEKEYNGLPKAMYDFLNKNTPDILDHNHGDPLYSNEVNLIPIITEKISKMNKTSIVIQGPPGTGKTYTCSHVVKKLLKDGKKIAISSNSHKAINNLLLKIVETVGDEYTYIKISSKEEPEFEGTSVENISSARKLSDDTPFDIIGGTVFALSNEKFRDKFDYLLIDEAGQFSLANLSSVMPIADNLVLIGDQMQLEQPISGIHAGESGMSCLEYYLNGHDTIPKEYGFFLPLSRRMNPSLGDVVSELFYESRLSSLKENSQRKLILKKSENLRKNEGVQFCPVNHSGNTQSSQEEVDYIVKLRDELLQSKIKLFEDGKLITRKIQEEDIIYVSPYNLQVLKLQESLGEKARVGSVDLFQGQEAPIVIISLASSKGTSGRGIEFLLNKNRINVALSRGKVIAYLVASNDIAKTKVSSVKELELLNMFCRLLDFIY